MCLAKVEQLAQGVITSADVGRSTDPVCQAFKSWTSALAMLSIVERPIEGWHARVTQLLRKSPNAGLSYVSSTLRFTGLCRAVDQNPEAVCMCTSTYLDPAATLGMAQWPTWPTGLTFMASLLASYLSSQSVVCDVLLLPCRH